MSNFEKDCGIGILSEEQMKNMKTRQLLAHLRHTYRWGDYDWEDADYSAKAAYQARVKAELATREHIPNKVESKKIRIARKKKGN
jgi:hypothetical protein